MSSRTVRRYRVKPRFWAMIALRRMKHAHLAPRLGVTQQWLSFVYRHPEQTVSERFVLAVERAFQIDGEEYFDAADEAYSHADTASTVTAA